MQGRGSRGAAGRSKGRQSGGWGAGAATGLLWGVGRGTPPAFCSEPPSTWLGPYRGIGPGPLPPVHRVGRTVTGLAPVGPTELGLQVQRDQWGRLGP